MNFSRLLKGIDSRPDPEHATLLRKGDPWFFLNLPIALICGLAFGPHVLRWLG